MPRSSRPRKKHQPRLALSPVSVSDRTVAGMREAFRTLETSMRLTLPTGAVHPGDMAMLEDAFNAFGVALVHRREASGAKEYLFEMAENREAVEAFLRAKTALHTLNSRRRDTSIRAARGDELRAIFQGFDVIFPFIDQSFENCPRQMIRELSQGRMLAGNFGEKNEQKR